MKSLSLGVEWCDRVVSEDTRLPGWVMRSSGGPMMEVKTHDLMVEWCDRVMVWWWRWGHSTSWSSGEVKWWCLIICFYGQLILKHYHVAVVLRVSIQMGVMQTYEIWSEVAKSSQAEFGWFSNSPSVDAENSKKSQKWLIYSIAGSTARRDPVIEYNRMTKSENAEIDHFTLSRSLTVSRLVWSSRMVENRKILKFNSKWMKQVSKQRNQMDEKFLRMG